jgi:RND family efflux transporter MFP subunit
MRHTSIAILITAAVAFAQSGNMATVISKPSSRITELPGEFAPFLSVPLHAKIPAFVEKVNVDRGSAVKEGQLLIELSAPEMTARIAEAESKAQSVESERLQAEAQVAGLESTLQRLRKASETPGAIARNEIEQVEKQIEAARAVVRARQQGSQAARAAVDAEKQLQSYLRIVAPFDGIVTERSVHPGALVGRGNDSQLLLVQQIARLRLVVQVPEEHTGVVPRGMKVTFKVPAHPERSYSGVVARNSHTVDKATRTMPVELDVLNRDGSLAPGMYATVQWPVRRATASLFVPRTSVVTTTERVFVIRNENGRAKWVDVRKGSIDGDLIEITGPLKAGDSIIRRATDEIRDGSSIQ